MAKATFRILKLQYGEGDTTVERKNRLILAAALTSLGLFLIGFAFGQAAPLPQTNASPSSRSQICAAEMGDHQRAYDQFLTIGAVPTDKNGNPAH